MITETPIYLQPAFVIFAAGTIIGGVSASITFTVWLIRQEQRLAYQSEKLADVEKEVVQARTDLAKHKEKEQLHFNPGIAAQVEAKQDARMSRIEADVKETKNLVEKLLLQFMEKGK